LDKENEILKEQLTILKNEMEDATEKMNEMTEELRTAQIKTVEYKGIYTYTKKIYFLCNEFDDLDKCIKAVSL